MSSVARDVLNCTTSASCPARQLRHTARIAPDIRSLHPLLRGSSTSGGASSSAIAVSTLRSSSSGSPCHPPPSASIFLAVAAAVAPSLCRLRAAIDASFTGVAAAARGGCGRCVFVVYTGSDRLSSIRKYARAL
eukprot:CAMPEP_0118928426 /NCGR_PEP_ID=MMETSP1169-20130426/5678_1 /TAXON_ID=36882 /ORGANISM="Pyramimonas obovata, Strain CCMP722" /LENGTH=133 /DNA_ID=CAMNT_0006870387 /DNA_START=217 /DNA_END=619 /DNA_ORIENTATION=-